ncbi:hypothetical protein K227x_54880 [Rubripirellula lacrimiformis]|uniref:Uncharacterized protein n=1 Tax=Rubripirellula lacrimiformis TaxID=1930273 RepID=A0A517NJ51_9BACT|nr:hypothetical protein [Rubripirellula lacrimiformis]QDT07063.1 hypothetical protein K227x_54880 [Rubripirellula lacrimiformis]
MQTVLGIAMIVIGLLMSAGGLTKSEFIVYRVLALRSRPLWGDKVHLFYMVSGLMVAAFGVLFALGVVGQ